MFSSPPANPAFSLLSCPLSPSPLPQWGRGILSSLMQGAPPLASPVAEPGRHLQPLPSKASGGVAGFLPRLPTLLLACFLAPYPPLPLPQWGRGILSFLMQGAPPLASPVAEPGRHLQPLPSKASGGVAGFLPRPTPRQPSATSAQIHAAPPPVNTIIEESSWGFGGFFQEAPNASSLPRPLASLRIRSDCVTIRRGRTYHGNGSRPGRTTRTVCPSTAASCAGGAAHRHQPEEE